jgi:hypothetical protein
MVDHSIMSSVNQEARSSLVPNRPKSVALVPTNHVTTKDGITVRARIDPTLTVDDVIRQLCISLKLADPPARYALRDDADELVTNDNLRKMIRTKRDLKLVVRQSLPLFLYISAPLDSLALPQWRQRKWWRSLV